MSRGRKSEIVKSWLDQSKTNWRTANNLFSTKDYYACLFFCHLTIEKILKSLVLESTDKPAPYTHDLVQLSKLSKLEISKSQKEILKDVTKFNILTRYKNDKEDFYKLCNKVYTEEYLNKTRQLYLWLKKQFQKN